MNTYDVNSTMSTPRAWVNAMAELSKVEGDLMALAALDRLDSRVVTGTGCDDDAVYELATRFWKIANAARGIATPALLNLQEEILLLGIGMSFNDWSFADLAVTDELSRCGDYTEHQ